MLAYVLLAKASHMTKAKNQKWERTTQACEYQGGWFVADRWCNGLARGGK